MLNRNVADISVSIREFDMENSETRFPPYEVGAHMIITHSRFVRETYDNDIALILLTHRLSWDPYTVPVCLPTQRKKVLAGHNGILVGWGRLSEEGQRSKRPLKLSVPIVDMASCERVLGQHNVNPTKFCAGYLEGGRDACQGDSGGALVLQVGNQYIQEGIISSGVGCARKNFYGLYTRISEFIPWLRTAMNQSAPPDSTLSFEARDVFVRRPIRRNAFLEEIHLVLDNSGCFTTCSFSIFLLAIVSSCVLV